MSFQRIRNRLAAQKHASLYRHAPVIQKREGKNLYLDDRKVLNFASNDYLGLGVSESLKHKVGRNFQKYHSSSSSSRLVSGNYSVISKVEKEYAEYFGYEDALFFPSGYQANIGVISTFFEKGDTIIFDKHIHVSSVKGMASKPFDGEGVATLNRIIVDQGILKGFMYNTKAAKRAGVESTGNASRGGFTRLPGIGCHNFYMAAGSHDPEAIIRATRRGLYLKGVTGYGINPVNGNFSGGARGFWLENGRIAFPVKGLTIAGSAFEMLAAIDMVGNDLDLNRSFTAPTFRIREIQIGGE